MDNLPHTLMTHTPREERFNFEGLFVFEMANNHQGDVEHGKRIIREMAKLAKEFGVKAAVKLQFRDLDTFVHPAEKNSKDNKHVQRFLSTKLSEDQFAELIRETKEHGLLTMCTPFDEPSVDQLARQGIEILKIGSCSAKDWPLLEKAVQAGKPMIVSTGGMHMKDVDNLVSFLDHRYANFALMHCVAVYPTPKNKLRLRQIEVMRERYPEITIGFSTHEDPDNTSAIQLAFAKGARMFEKHVGVPTDTIKLNAYSANPDQVRAWLTAYQDAVDSCGNEESLWGQADEAKDLHLLMRGVFAMGDIKKGQIIHRDDVFFAFPIQQGQMSSGQWRDGIVADRDYAKNMPLLASLSERPLGKKELIYGVIHDVKGMLNAARIPVGLEFSVELSHHYGMKNFRECGVVIIDCINREYCKKLLIQLPGQRHPYHHHKKKEETFQMLAGKLEVELEGKYRRTLYPGDTLVIQRGVKHRFWTDSGAIFEEVSTTHYNDDSMYDDPSINTKPREERKTKLVNWGRHQFD
ncbi:MAG: hypothetical protein AMXMBFR16_02680 [Candidatus Uhrbacteria bacterium]